MVIVINTIFLFLAIVAVILRFWARFISKRSISLDDYLIVAGLIFTIGTIACGYARMSIELLTSGHFFLPIVSDLYSCTTWRGRSPSGQSLNGTNIHGPEGMSISVVYASELSIV